MLSKNFSLTLNVVPFSVLRQMTHYFMSKITQYNLHRHGLVWFGLREMDSYGNIWSRKNA